MLYFSARRAEVQHFNHLLNENYVPSGENLVEGSVRERDKMAQDRFPRQRKMVPLCQMVMSLSLNISYAVLFPGCPYVLGQNKWLKEYIVVNIT